MTRKRPQKPPQELKAGSAPDLGHFSGLTEEVAAERRSPDRPEEAERQARQVRRDIWRSSTFSIFNLNMLGLAAAQALLGDPLSALLTFGVFLLNVGLNAAQQLYATNRVEALLALTRPLATVIRDGRIKSADIDEIVVGDVLVVGPGDEFLAEGELLSGTPTVLEAPAIGGESRSQVKGSGDPIRAGTYCLQGRAVYEISTLPGAAGARQWTPVPEKAELTPLQRIMARVLRLMLALIVFFLALLILDMLELPILSQLFEDVYREAASGLFSIAPSSLFFMIVATYAIGSARLGDLGALVRESRAVESLAQISVICFSKTGALTGARVQVEMIASGEEQPAFAESRVRQMLGDFAHSTRSDNAFLQALASNFDGSHRPVEETASIMSAYGWSALTFSEADVRGSYVIGEPETLLPILGLESLSAHAGEEEAEVESTLQKSFHRVGRLFKRSSRKKHEDDEAENEATRSSPQAARQTLSPDPQLIFAYSPEPIALYDADSRPQLPPDLIPLCALHFKEQIRPEARQALQAFTEAEVSVKILSSDDPEPVLDSARQLGLAADQATPETVVSGSRLAEMEESLLEQTVQEANVFAQLTSEQKGEIVRALRRQGERVAMVGDSVDDIAAMEGSNLRLTLRSGSQAVLGLADIVLLEDSFQVLPTVLERGQRLVNGMLDILKINLAQIGYILLLTIVMFATGKRIFYYHPTQGGVIAFFTVIVPSVGLTLWASSGSLPRQYMRSRMAHFVVPAAITMTLAVLVVSTIFGRGIFDIAYSQLAVTHLLVTIGLILIVFVQPPTRFWVGGDVLSNDWRNTYMAAILFVLFVAATYLPLTQELLRLASLDEIRDYLAIAAVAVLWMVILRALYRAPWLNRYVGILSDRLEKE
jgi:cation-transporting ATPase E